MSDQDRFNCKSKLGFFGKLRRFTPPINQHSKIYTISSSSTMAPHSRLSTLDDVVDTVLNCHFHCPALTCQLMLSQDQVLIHAQTSHALVISHTPCSHANLIEACEDDMAGTEVAGGWAPTWIEAFGREFFFEVWRSSMGIWYVWVYLLGSTSESEIFIADIELFKDYHEISYSGPVFSLTMPRQQIISQGACLTFSDGMAKSLLEELDTETTGICYKMQIRKRPKSHRSEHRIHVK